MMDGLTKCAARQERGSFWKIKNCLRYWSCLSRSIYTDHRFPSKLRVGEVLWKRPVLGGVGEGGVTIVLSTNQRWWGAALSILGGEGVSQVFSLCFIDQDSLSNQKRVSIKFWDYCLPSTLSRIMNSLISAFLFHIGRNRCCILHHIHCFRFLLLIHFKGTSAAFVSRQNMRTVVLFFVSSWNLSFYFKRIWFANLIPQIHEIRRSACLKPNALTPTRSYDSEHCISWKRKQERNAF